MNSVYFARCGAYVKIGFSYRPEQRIKHLFNGSLLAVPDDLDRSAKPELLRVIPDCIMKDERAMHERFARFRAVGEWFRATDELLREIAHLDDYVTVRQQRLEARRRRRAAKAAAASP